jgi:hypothetical protein
MNAFDCAHPLRISLHARAAGSRDTFIVSVSHQCQYYVRLLVLFANLGPRFGGFAPFFS